jgi:DNA polymerase-1
MRLHIVDGGGFLHRAWHATTNVASKPEAPAALRAFSSMLEKIEFENRAEIRGVVAFDLPGPTWRHAMFPAYKANRKPPDDALRALMPYFPSVAEARGWIPVSADGYEADDVIATLARSVNQKGMKVVIHASDKDLMALVNPLTTQVDAVRGVVFDEAGVLAKMKVPPSRIADLLAVRGDDGDGVPGVPGAGDKTAAELVAQYASIEDMIAANPRIRGKYPLAGPGADALRLSRALVELAHAKTMTPPNLARRSPFGPLPGEARRPALLQWLLNEHGRPPWSPGDPFWANGLVNGVGEYDYHERTAMLEYMGGQCRHEAEWFGYRAAKDFAERRRRP